MNKTIMTAEDIIDSKNEEITHLKKLIKCVQNEIKGFLEQECLPTVHELEELVTMLEI